MKTNRLAIFTAAAAVIMVLAPRADAVDGTWNTDAGGAWDTSATTPWLNSIVASDADFTAYFNAVNITANRTISLTNPLTIGNLAFGDKTTASNDWTLSGATLTLQRTSGTPTIAVDNRSATISLALQGTQGMTKDGAGTLILSGNNLYSGTTTISAGTLQIGSDGLTGSVSGAIVNNATLKLQRSNANTISGDISGTGSVTILNSSNTVTLAGNNIYQGGTTLSDGALLLGSGTNNGIGTGALTIGRGKLGSSDNNSRTIANTLNLNISGSLTFGAAQGAATGLGNLTFSDSTSGTGPGAGNTITVNNSTVVTLNKQFTTGQITKAGTGTLVLNGSSSFTGATKVSGGILGVNKLADGGSNSGIGAATSANTNLILAGGTLQFTGSSNGSTNRLFSLAYGPNNASSVLDASGAVPMRFTGAGDVGVAANSVSTPWQASIPAGTQFTMNDVSQIAAGMGVTGTYIPANTYVTAVDTVNKKITLNQASTTAITNNFTTFTFYGGPRTLTLTGSNTGESLLAANLTDAPLSNGSQATLSHAASLVKQGNSTWNLTGSSTYSGGTQISGGKLLVNNAAGSATGTGLVQVLSGGTLGGTGTISGAVSVSGTGILAPGAHQALKLGNGLSLTGGSLAIDIASDGSYDSLQITGGNVSLGEHLASLNFSSQYVPTASSTFWILDNTGGNLSGNFASLLNSGDVVKTIGNATYRIYYNADKDNNLLFGGNDLAVVASIPEPATLGLAVGVSGLALLRRRRHA